MYQYILKCIRGMDIKKFWKTIKIISKETKIPAFVILVDMIYCGFRYGAGFNDYFLCGFSDLTAKQRKTYITRGRNQMLSAKMNQADYKICLQDKKLQYKIFAFFVQRAWLDMQKNSPEALKKFLSLRNEVIIKPSNGSGGEKIERLRRADFASLKDMAHYISETQTDIVEEVIHQHPDLERLNASSVNTIRIVTVLAKKEVHIMYAFLRIGNGKEPVDNLHRDGIFAPIDLSAGVISAPGYDKNRTVYSVHPVSGVTIKGFQIPSWNAVLDLCRNAAYVVPQIKYVGWDIAVTECGTAVLVEGNHLPGHDILQMPPHVGEEKVGLLPEFETLLSCQ